MRPYPYIRGQPIEKPPPLERHQPPFPSNIVPIWLKKYALPKGIILDPLGSSPQLLLEAAQYGYRILTTANNPISRFLLRQVAAAPKQADLKSSLASLASTYKGNERLEPHLLSLYRTECPHCGKTISAKAFLWKKDAAAPHAKIYHCSYCGDSGEHPTTPSDIQKATQFQDNSLYHARALTRVAPPGDPIRTHAEKALKAYTARAVYALFTLINKVIGMSLSPQEEANVSALVLSACYHGGNYWSYPPTQQAITQLIALEQYQEKNIWYAMEDAVTVWGHGSKSIPVTDWPELPPLEGGLTVFPGPMRDLGQELSEEISAVLLAHPRPNLAYWTLSALWTGWLWGQQAAKQIHTTLRLQRFNWGWYTRALYHTIKNVEPLLEPSTPCLGLIYDTDEDFLISAMQASYNAGLSIRGIAIDTESKCTQLMWKPQPVSDSRDVDVKLLLRSSGYTQLKSMGEPTPSLILHAAGLAALDAEKAFPASDSKFSEESFQELKISLEDAFAYRQGFLFYPEINRWWHQELELSSNYFSDQVEQKVVRLLAENKQGCLQKELENALYAEFPGLRTPNTKLIQTCLESYGQQQPTESGVLWKLRPGDSPSARREDLQEMATKIQQLGKKLDYHTKKAPPLGNIRMFTWEENTGIVYTFYISASAILSKILVKCSHSANNVWIILPGSRSNLVTHKLQSHPPLNSIIEKNWGFLKFRHLRSMANDRSLTRETLQERFKQDPLTYTAPQLPLI